MLNYVERLINIKDNSLNEKMGVSKILNTY
jgi:hypothetical protein